jgi:hypothetical protein
MKNLNRDSMFAIILSSAILLSCQGERNSIKQEDCNKSYQKATSALNNYYVDSNKVYLDTAYYVVEKVYGTCPEFKSRFTNLKISLLLLRQEYESGYRFVDSLEENEFRQSYKKKLYLKTFQALTFEQQGDTSQRNEYFEKLVVEIEIYISVNPSDKDAIADLFYTKLKFKEKAEVKREIDSMQTKRNNEKDFFNALKEAISASPQ